jgi:hypothetical protein
MAGDIEVMERPVLEVVTRGAERVIHQYGRLDILAIPEEEPEAASRRLAEEISPSGLTEVERLGLEALRLRESREFRTAKRNRPRAGELWDMPDCTTVVPQPPDARAAVAAAAPTSQYLEGTVAVGIIIVEGPTADLKFSDSERTKVVAEVQNGLSFYATANPVAGISFAYDIQIVTVATPPDPNAADLEALWRDPAMGALGFSADWAGVTAYIEDIRNRFGTRWTYCGFFTKYPLGWFAYASIGGPRLVMQYANDGWGPDNIDRVFAHETGHIFGCPDEYASSNCNCGGTWGRFGIANGNCENCASGGGVACLMKGNTFAVCGYTPSHLGWAPQLLVRNYGYNAGGWRVDQHPRFMADTRGNGRADIVGFGDAGAYVSRALADGRFQTPVQVVNNFGYNAGGWRVDQHPRFLADTTSDGRADIVGFGNEGVWVSLNNGDGTFQDPPSKVVGNFAYNAGGWRVERHPRYLADLTGDGRVDIVGFGNEGVWVSLNNGDGTFQDPPSKVVGNFAYNAGGWRVERHPRFLADTTGDGRADIVGCGDAGVYVSRLLANGSFEPPGLVITNFGYNAGGWRVERHPRFLADTTGDGRADIVGCGDAGVYVSRF